MGHTAFFDEWRNAPRLLPRLRLAQPVWWAYDELRLVLGTGQPYHYQVLGRWPLLPDPDPPQTQQPLF